MTLPGLGESGQKKLQEGSVLVVGAGGLGCPALPYLAGAGVGRIGVIDDDVVELTNLHRQVLFTMDDLGARKVFCAAERLRALNPEISVEPYSERLGKENALELIARYDVILDGTDNFATRYLVNDACVLMGKPLVYGAVSRYEGQVAVFNVADENGAATNYRDLFPVPPADGEVLNCAAGGVLGVLPGIIGTLQATEVIKLLTGIGTPLSNRLMIYNLLNARSYTLDIRPRAKTRQHLPDSREAFLQRNYEWECGLGTTIREITAGELGDLQQAGQTLVVDVRELWEKPEITTFQRVPLSALKAAVPDWKETTIALVCQSGVRSLLAAELVQQHFEGSKEVVSLKGGIAALQQAGW